MSSESVPGGGEDELKRKVTRLQERLSETERDMHQAAQIGKELLTANNQLTEDHETERRGTAKKIEVGEVIIVKPGPAEQPAHRGPREGEERHCKENRGRRGYHC